MTTTLLTESTETVVQGLQREAALFAERALNARSVACVEGAYTKLLASPHVEQARVQFRNGDPSVKAQKAAFQSGLSVLYESARSFHHSRFKPYGYPGDFGILELVYDQIQHPETATPGGAVADRWGVQTALPTAVRKRKDALRYWLEQYAEQHGGPIRLLSFAAGAARELRELQPRLLQRFDATLLDLDPRGLRLAETAFNTRPVGAQVQCVLGDAVAGDESTAALAREQRFDIVYSFGLFDYLTDEQVLRSANNFVPCMADDGRFIFCLKDHRFYDGWYYDWFFNWKFVPRTVADGYRIADRLGLRVTEMLPVAEGIIGIFVCERA